MQRRSFLKTLACGLLATKLAFDLGAKEVVTDNIGFKLTPGNWKFKIDPNPLRFRYENGKYIQIQ